jgi:hypothetical protein
METLHAYQDFQLESINEKALLKFSLCFFNTACPNSAYAFKTKAQFWGHAVYLA